MASVTGGGEGGGGVCVTQVHGRTEPGRTDWILQLILMHIIGIFCFFVQLFYILLHWVNTPCRIQSVRQATLHVKKVAAKREKGRGEGRRVQERKIGESAFNGSQVARPSVRPPCVRVRPPSRCLCSLRPKECHSDQRCAVVIRLM